MIPSDSPGSAASIVDVLRVRADATPDRLAFVFLTDGEEEGQRLTYAGLDIQARAVAACLQESAGPGDRALLLYAPGLEFIPAFFGCLYAGVVPSRPTRRASTGWCTAGRCSATLLPTAGRRSC